MCLSVYCNPLSKWKRSSIKEKRFLTLARRHCWKPGCIAFTPHSEVISSYQVSFVHDWLNVMVSHIACHLNNGAKDRLVGVKLCMWYFDLIAVDCYQVEWIKKTYNHGPFPLKNKNKKTSRFLTSYLRRTGGFLAMFGHHTKDVCVQNLQTSCSHIHRRSSLAFLLPLMWCLPQRWALQALANIYHLEI